MEAPLCDFSVPSLGDPKIDSPVALSRVRGDSVANYVGDEEHILYEIDVTAGATSVPVEQTRLLEKAGPRQKIYFNPGHVHAAIVTCGGLCPGINDVIRAIVRSLWYSYGVRRITGIRFGYRGFLPEYRFPTVELNPAYVDDIHKIGGTVLGASRGGGERTVEIVDAIERMNLNILFTIGGDGTQKGALLIADEIERRGMKAAIVGIPKTIDNDLAYTQKSFGFETAVALAARAVATAHAEAHAAINGIGLVKLMGRESGFIAAHTALAVHEANFVLIPEVRFDLDGPNGLFENLKQRLLRRNHAVIIVAEGAGQHLLPRQDAKDASGNKRLADIGVFLRERIVQFFAEQKMEVNLKYIDPSYMIRSSPAEPNDSVYCARLGANAVHAALSGKTKVLLSQVHNTFVHLPIKTATSSRNHVDPESSLWRDVIEAVQQPVLMQNT